MLDIRQTTLAKKALLQIDQLLNNFDHGGQIESAVPLLLRHRRALSQLCALLGQESDVKVDAETWKDDLVTAYIQLGGHAHHSMTYYHMKRLRIAAGRTWPNNAEETIRATLQAHPELFRRIRHGLWGLRKN